MRMELGKISSSDFTLRRGVLALELSFTGKAWGCDWRVYDLNEITDTLTAAKVDRISKLTGKPVECTFEGGVLKSWRILEEVL